MSRMAKSNKAKTMRMRMRLKKHMMHIQTLNSAMKKMESEKVKLKKHMMHIRSMTRKRT